VILANLVLGEMLVPEFLQAKCTAQALASALVPLFTDTAERRLQIEAFARLDGIMGVGQAAPSDRAAAAVLDCAGAFNQSARETVASSVPGA
jgi:lipid-A-disaccharide synthase